MKKSYVITPVVAAALGMTGLAFAAFTTNSEPWAGAKVGSAQHPTVTDAHVVGDLYPGDCNDVTMTIANPNSHAVEITNLGTTGFRNSTDGAASEQGNASRLEDFLTQADKHDALTGVRIGAERSKTVLVRNAVCLSAAADDARQGKAIEAGYFVAYTLLPGTEAPGAGTAG